MSSLPLRSAAFVLTVGTTAAISWYVTSALNSPRLSLTVFEIRSAAQAEAEFALADLSEIAGFLPHGRKYRRMVAAELANAKANDSLSQMIAALNVYDKQVALPIAQVDSAAVAAETYLSIFTEAMNRLGTFLSAHPKPVPAERNVYVEEFERIDDDSILTVFVPEKPQITAPASDWHAALRGSRSGLDDGLARVRAAIGNLRKALGEARKQLKENDQLQVSVLVGNAGNSPVALYDLAALTTGPRVNTTLLGSADLPLQEMVLPAKSTKVLTVTFRRAKWNNSTDWDKVLAQLPSATASIRVRMKTTEGRVVVTADLPFVEGPQYLEALARELRD